MNQISAAADRNATLSRDVNRQEHKDVADIGLGIAKAVTGGIGGLGKLLMGINDFS